MLYIVTTSAFREKGTRNNRTQCLVLEVRLSEGGDVVSKKLRGKLAP